MNFLFDFTYPRSAGRAGLFYLGHLAIVLFAAAVAGAITAGQVHADSVQSAAATTGEIVATAYPVLLCVLVVMQRGLAPIYCGLAIVVLPIAYVTGGIGGLILPALLTTRGHTTDGAVLAPSMMSRRFAPRKEANPSGYRIFGH